jgi:hypothetical protein
VAAALNQGNCFANASSTGLSAEFPFGMHDTSLLTVDTHEQHPQLGHGLLLRLHLAEAFGQGNVPFTAMMLNTLETRHVTQTHLIGSWCAAPLGSGVQVPAFVAFIPNALYKPGLLYNLVLGMALRARWAAAEIQGPSQEGSVLRTLITWLHALSPWRYWE